MLFISFDFSNSFISFISFKTLATKKNLKVTFSDAFIDKIAEFQNFMTQCTFTFTSCLNIYPENENCVLFVISYLRDIFLTWTNDIIFDQKHSLRKDCIFFQVVFINLYDDHAYEMKYEEKIRHFAQTDSAVSYIQTFQTLMTSLKLELKFKYLIFFDELKLDVKKTIIIAKCFIVFQDLINQAIKFDQLFYQ